MIAQSYNSTPAKPGAYLPRLDEALRNLETNRRARAATPLKPEAIVLPTWPNWPDICRAVPNGFLRSALFGAIGRGRRRYINGEDISSIEGVYIRYKGERLDQGDLDVWESILQSVRVQEVGRQCRLTSYSLLKMIGKKDTGGNRLTLQNRIERFVASALTIKQGRYTYIGGLIRFAAKDEETQEWVIGLDEKLRPLFAADQFTLIDWSIRQKLDGKPLAQWLHGFYSSHAQPFAMKIETLLKLSGTENENPRSANQKLKKGLAAVSEASKGSLIFSFRGDLVKVTKRVKKMVRINSYTVTADAEYRHSGCTIHRPNRPETRTSAGFQVKEKL